MHDFQDGALRQELSAAWEALEVHLNSADAAGLQAILLKAKPLIQALHNMNAFILKASLQTRTEAECERRMVHVCLAATIFGNLVGACVGAALSLPTGMVKSLLGGVALSLEAGTSTLQEWLKVYTINEDSWRPAYGCAVNHVCAVANVQRATANMSGGPAVAAALLKHNKVLPLLAAAALVYEQNEAPIQQEIMQQHGPSLSLLRGLSTLLNTLCGHISATQASPGGRALAAALEVHRRVAWMLFGIFRPLATAAPEMQDGEMDVLPEAMAAVAIVIFAAGSPAPWAPWAAEQSGVLALELCAAALPPAQRADQVPRRIRAAGVIGVLGFQLLNLRHGDPAPEDVPRSFLRSAACAVSHAAAGLMLLADQLLPEPRYNGAAEHVVLPEVPPPLAGPASGAGTGSTSAPGPSDGSNRRVYAAHEIALRFSGEVPHLLVQLSPQTHPTLLSVAYSLQTTAASCSGLMTATETTYFMSDLPTVIDLAITAAKLAAFAQQQQLCNRHPQVYGKDFLSKQLAAAVMACERYNCVLQCDAIPGAKREDINALWLPHIQGIVPVLLAGWHAVRAMPPTPETCEAIVLEGVVNTVCGTLCALPCLVEVVEEAGGFQLLADQAAVVFNQSAPSTVLGLPQSRERAKETLEMLTGDMNSQSPWLLPPVAASPLPATLAAWAAAALRRGEHQLVTEVLPVVARFLDVAWVWAWGDSMVQVFDTSNEVFDSPESMPSLELYQRWTSFEDLTADEYERMAVEIMPQVAAGLQSSRSSEAVDTAERALQWARAMATRRCSNPRCITLAGCSERAQPGKLCAGCKAARYCSRACQKADWKAHKAVCAALAAEKIAAAAEQE